MIDSETPRAEQAATRTVDAGTASAPGRPLVVIADDHQDMREALADLLESVGIDTLSFENARELLEAELPDRPGCFVLDVRMPGISGLDLQAQLSQREHAMPIIFITGHADVPMSIKAMKAGASDFLTKPVREQELLDAVWTAIDADRSRRIEQTVVSENVSRYDTLSRRERQVLSFVAQGHLNKQIAYELGVSEVTIKLHRGAVMKKMAAGSVAELARMWDALPALIRLKDPG
ncbi:response regulator transcription factor [Sphingomonas sp. BK235]|uniref:response regulator transcription factor n=1 Tax=Sphingomonas sp. BK235 TaxID=2512131 RepID=UPI001FB5EB77|nr:response regulator transcription factor [Sphingomonas sp. BK235]